jgi:hypothetical protein
LVLPPRLWRLLAVLLALLAPTVLGSEALRTAAPFLGMMGTREQLGAWRSSEAACAKKQCSRVQPGPVLHIVVRKRSGCSQYSWMLWE